MLIHPLVVHFPLALWLTSALFDFLAWRQEDPMFRRAARWLVGLGLLGAGLSILFGWMDLLVQERQGVGTGLLLQHRTHSLVAYLATASYVASFLWRVRMRDRIAGGLLTLSLLGALLIAVTGYLGGELRNVM
ncbi:MAG TPA: DUF2231 domain-containing protein [Candidatus Methylomirabilis sp.]|nr:DUF2231 domain-containing protein [Candidatus Methylomirabilis sp.]